MPFLLKNNMYVSWLTYYVLMAHKFLKNIYYKICKIQMFYSNLALRKEFMIWYFIITCVNFMDSPSKSEKVYAPDHIEISGFSFDKKL